jgi:hypothetical protein
LAASSAATTNDRALAALRAVTAIFDAFWRAAAYCLHWRVILLSLAPVLIAAGVVAALGWFLWEPAVDAVQTAMTHWTLGEAALAWLERVGGAGLRAAVAPLVVVAIAVPLVVLLSLLLVAWLMTPTIVGLVARRRFPDLEVRRGAAGWQTALFALGITAVAAVVLVISVPLWLVPPLALVLPPLIWGWASGKVFAFEALAEHADAAERRALLRAHRGPLLAMGVISGLMGAVPAIVWAVGALAIVLAPLLLIVSVWLYTLVFAFAAAWFAHYALAALHDARRQAASVMEPAVATTTDLTPAALPPPAT